MMYAETGVMFPYFHSSFSLQEAQLFDDFACSLKPNASPPGLPSSFLQTSTISDYNLGGEGDLFKAPEPVIGELSIGLDPMAAAISMISTGEDVICPQSLTVSDIETSFENGQLLSEVFYECRKDLLAKEVSEVPLSEVLGVKIPADETFVADEKLCADGPFQKSVSSDCLRSMDIMIEAPLGPNFLDFPVLDFGAVYGMRRAFSEGDIKALANGDISLIHSPVRHHNFAAISCSSKDRREKLSRYRSKKSRRNFGRKIKYACRKALADSQPRIRGRFAKTEEIESFSRKQ